jgi:hypothetical protein
MNNLSNSAGDSTVSFEILKIDTSDAIIANAAEKQLLTSTIEEWLTGTPQNDFRFSRLIIQSTSGSTLDLAQRAEKKMLEDMLNSDDFINFANSIGLPTPHRIMCDSQRNIYHRNISSLMNFTNSMDEYEVLKRQLDNIYQHANSTGGYLYSTDEINIEQWLRFHEYPVPTTLKQVKYLVRCLKLEFPKTPPIADYFATLRDPKSFPTALPQEHRNEILKITSTSSRTNGNGMLLGHLHESIIGGTSTSQLRLDSEGYIARMLDSQIGRIWADSYLKTLGWYGSHADQSPSNDDLRQLLITAILLNIDPQSGLNERRGQVLGYELYKPANAELPPYQILLNMEKHLVDSSIINANVAPLAVHFYTAAVAPEFLVQKLPDTLTICSPGWPMFSFTVAKLEAIAPGSTRLMTYEQVLAYSGIEPFTEQMEQLFGLLVVGPILNWAAINNIIPYNAQGEYSDDDFVTANDRYTVYTEALEQCNNALSTPLPTREDIALKELKRVLRDGSYLTAKDHYHAALNFDDPLSVHDMFMSGHLLSDGWTGSELASNVAIKISAGHMIKSEQSKFHKLQNIENLYKVEFKNYFDQLKAGFIIALKLAISKMLPADRAVLECGIVSLYTVRKKFSDSAAKETQRVRDKRRGRYGIIVCAETTTGRHYYELFTLRAECIKRQDFKRVFERSDIELQVPSIFLDKNEQHWQRQDLDWPLDFEAYLNGTEPVKNKTSRVVVEKLWQSSETQASGHKPVGQMQSFFSMKTHELINTVLEYCPPVTYEELYAAGYGMTAIEAALKNRDENVELILNLIIPFKSCIEDLASGDPDRQSSGMVGCALDALAMVTTVVGAAPKVASIALKSTSVLAKSLKLVRFSGSFVLSLINPLDGVPSLIKKGGKLCKYGSVQLTELGSKTVGKATGEIKTLCGTLDKLKTVKSLKRPGVIPAYLQDIGDLSEATECLIFKRGYDWYQLDLETFKLRGPKIVNFRVATAQ